MRSIQRKITMLILSGIIFVVLVVELVGLSIMNKALDRDSAQMMNLLCTQQAGKLNEYLRNVEQSVNTIYKVAIEGLNRRGDIFSNQEEMDSYIAEMRELSSIVAENTEGAIAVYYRFNHLLTDPLAGFFRIKPKDAGKFIDYQITDLSLYTEEDVEYVSWYYEPLRAGKAIWMDPYSNENIGVEMISYVIPIYYNGITIGVLGMDIDILAWQEQIAAVSLYDTGSGFLVDSEENIVYHEDYPNGIANADIPEEWKELNKLMQENLKYNDVYNYELDGEKKAMTVTRLDNGMMFGVIVPKEEVKEPSVELMLLTVVVAVLTAIVVCLCSIRICRAIIKFAYKDAMTGVNNKTAYEEVVETISQEIREKRANFALIIFDVNNLKRTNDTYGHEQGDTLIMESAELIEEVYGKKNVFRIGGDEFAVLLRHEEKLFCVEKLNEFGRKLEEYNREQTLNPEDIQIARGMAVYNSGKDASYMDVFRRADKLMYENKKNQKGQKLAGC